MHEKQLRIRYIRVLEKFFTRTVSLLKLENFDHELFKQRTLKNYDEMNKTKVMEVHSPYLTSLKRFVDLTLSYIKNHSKSFESEREGHSENFIPIKKILLEKTILKDKFDVAVGNDPDFDRHGIVTKSGGLMNPNHYLAVSWACICAYISSASRVNIEYVRISPLRCACIADASFAS